MSFIPLSSKSEKLATFKSFSWNLKVDNEDLCITLECFLMTNKRRVILNKQEVFTGNKPYFKDFEWSYNWNKHVISILNQKSRTDLILDGVSFTQKYSLRLTNRMHQQVEEVKVFQDIARSGQIEDHPAGSSSKNLFNPDHVLSSSGGSDYDFGKIFK